jgi:primosomal replication protein N
MTASICNQLNLSAQLQALQALRYTPAGVPALDFEVLHLSTQSEAGQARQTQFTLRAIVFGMLAEQLAKQPLGAQLQCQGFLAAGKNGKGLVYHLQSFESLF